MTATRGDLDALFADIAPRLDRLRAICRFDDFAEGAAEVPAGEVADCFAAHRAEAGPLAEEVDAALAAFARRLNAAEQAGCPPNPAARMLLAQSQRTGGAPYPLMDNWPEARPADWPAARAAAAQRRSGFAFWIGAVEDFRKRSAARIAKLGD